VWRRVKAKAGGLFILYDGPDGPDENPIRKKRREGLLTRMFHGNAEFWGNFSEPVFAIARGSIAIATVQGGS